MGLKPVQVPTDDDDSLLTDVVAVVGTFFQKQSETLWNSLDQQQAFVLYGHRRLFRGLHVFSVYCVLWKKKESLTFVYCEKKKKEATSGN